MSSPSPTIEPHRGTLGSQLRDYILGAQDGLVNVLGLVLGVASATSNIKVVLIAGFAALFAESLSMAAVAYTSSKAARDYYYAQLEKERREIETIPHEEKNEIREIYLRKGFRGTDLERIVERITSDKEVWLESMMAEELRLFPHEYGRPARSALVVGAASILGSLVPLVPFLLVPVAIAVWTGLFLSLAVLFAIGGIKARLTIGDWRKSGLEMAAIGGGAAVVGYLVGLLLGGL
jgi:predicted membrane protein (TIGR00267 family)